MIVVNESSHGYDIRFLIGKQQNIDICVVLVLFVIYCMLNIGDKLLPCIPKFYSDIKLKERQS